MRWPATHSQRAGSPATSHAYEKKLTRPVTVIGVAASPDEPAGFILFVTRDLKWRILASKLTALPEPLCAHA